MAKWAVIGWLVLIAPAYAQDDNDIAHPKACAREGICYTWKQYDEYQLCITTGDDVVKPEDYAKIEKDCEKILNTKQRGK